MIPERRTPASTYFKIRDTLLKIRSGVGWLAMCADTEGNTFGLFEEDPAAK